jgi:hypothetical protein
VADPDRVGTLAWAARSDGRLTASERRGSLPAILQTTGRYTLGRLRLALGLRAPDATSLAFDALPLPDSRLARDAEGECRELLTPIMVNHSLRTFWFGLALAQRDGLTLDREHLYVTSLLHDIALESPDPKCCFAIAGGRRMQALALRADCDAALAETLGDAIAQHITPGVDAGAGPLAPTIAAGAMLDLTGLRLTDLAPGFVAGVHRRHPRLGCAKHLAECWRREVRAFPEGRAAAVERLARFSLILRLSPHRD